MVVFGEIVEPSTRALWDDDIDEYPQNLKEKFKWKYPLSNIPPMETLYVVESDEMIDVFKTCILTESSVCINELENINLQVYKINSVNYLIICRSNEDRTFSEIAETVKPLLKKTNKIICFTSRRISSYQSAGRPLEPLTFIRHLTTSKRTPNTYLSEKFRAPNLITGLGSGIITLSIVEKFDCMLFVVYLESAILDSVNTKPVLNLIQTMYNGSIQSYKMYPRIAGNNMYM